MADGTLSIDVYDGSDHRAFDRGSQLERWLQKDLDLQNIFIPWDDGRYEIDELFTQIVPRFWEAGRIPMLTWELFLSSGPTPGDILSRIVDGQYDAYLEEWAHNLDAAVARTSVSSPPIYIRLGHEMNGDWYPWAPAGGRGTPEQYIQMWKHVWKKVETRLEENVQLEWVWAANSADIGAYEMEDLYPGDKYVDWLAIDAYNWGDTRSWSKWRSPTEVFQQPIRRLRELGTTPVAVTEFGSSSETSAGPDVEKKSEWITDAFTTFNDLDVELCIWFNEHKETDWAVFGGQRGDARTVIDESEYKTYSAFKYAVAEYG